MYLVDSYTQDMALQLESYNIYCNKPPRYSPKIYIGTTVNNRWIVYLKGEGKSAKFFDTDIEAIRAAAELSYRCYRAQQGSPV